MRNTFAVVNVGRTPSLKTKEVEEAEKSLTDMVTEVIETAYIMGYKDALIHVKRILPTDKKTVDILQLKLLLGVAIKNCEEKEDD